MKAALSILAAALCAMPALADTGEDTPRVTVCAQSLPPLSANGVGPRGGPSPEYIASIFDRTAIGEWFREFLRSEDTGYVPGGSRPPAVNPDPDPELPAVPLAGSGSMMLGAAGFLGLMMAAATMFRRVK